MMSPINAMTIRCEWALFYLTKRDLSKCNPHNKLVEVYHGTKQRRFLSTSEKELLMLGSLKKVAKQSQKSLVSTNPHSDRLHTNVGNSRLLLPSAGVDR